jgi:transposase-like protein
LARLRGKQIAKIAEDLGISESCLRNWMSRADIDDGTKPGLTSDERAELVRLRREKRVLEMEVKILKRASAYFARENVLPKWLTPSSWTGVGICRSSSAAAR